MQEAQWTRRLGGTAVLAPLVFLCGCTHYHYYGNQPVRVVASPGVVTTAPVGSICELPSSEPLYVQGPIGVASQPQSQSQVLVSQPNGSRGGVAWHRPDPERLATSTMDGAIPPATRVK